MRGVKESQKNTTQAKLQLLKYQFAFILPINAVGFTAAKSVTEADWKAAIAAEPGTRPGRGGAGTAEPSSAQTGPELPGQGCSAAVCRLHGQGEQAQHIEGLAHPTCEL